VPKVFQPSVLKLLHTTLPGPRILRCLPNSRRIWYPLVQTTFATWTDDVKITCMAGVHKFKKSTGHFQITGASNNYIKQVPYAVESQIRTDLWTSLLTGAFSSVHVNWYALLFIGGEILQKLCWKIRRHHTKFSCTGDKAPVICTHLVQTILTPWPDDVKITCRLCS